MQHLSARVKGISPSPTLTIDAKTKQMIQEGRDVLNFSAGEPDFDTPVHVKAAAIEAINQGYTKYTPAAGALDLRQAICDKLRRDNGLEYQPNQIVVSNGGKHSLFNVYQTLCDPGDEVILQAPYWVSYPEMIRLVGAVPVIINSTAEQGFKLTPAQIEERLTPRTRAITLNSPSNPTGAVYTPAELEAIARLAVKHDLYIISDEIYEKMVYDGVEQRSIASFGPEVKARTITVNGMSKAFAMTGWRIGYTATEKYIADAMAALQGQTTSNPSSISQKASVAGLHGPADFINRMVGEFKRRRDYIVSRLEALPGIKVNVPKGAFYVFPNVSGLFGKTIRGRKIDSSDTLCQVLLEEALVAVVPGTGFGAPEHVRLSYATSMEKIKSGMDRLGAALAG